MALSMILKEMKEYSIKVADGARYDDPEMLKNRLWEMAKPESDISEELLRYNDRKHMVIYMANPVLMAFIIEDYELVHALLDRGYKPSCGMMDNQREVSALYFDTDTISEAHTKRINIIQWIMINPSIPDEIVVRVLDSLYLEDYIIRFNRDVLDNLYIYPDRKKVDDYEEGLSIVLSRLLGISKLDARYVNGGMSQFKVVDSIEKMGNFGEVDNSKRDNSRLIFDTVFEVYKEERDLKHVIEALIEKGNCNPDLVVRYLPKLKEIGDKYDGLRTQIVIELFNLYKQNEFGFAVPMRDEPLKNIRKWMIKIKGKTDMWDAFIEYMLKNSCIISMFGSFVEAWKDVFKENFIWDKSNMFYVMLLETISKKDKGFVFDTEEDVMRIIRFITSIDGIKCGTRKGKKLQRHEEKVMDNFLEYENEELFILCLKKKLFEGEQIDVLLEKALNKKKSNLVPLFIYAKNREEV